MRTNWLLLLFTATSSILCANEEITPLRVTARNATFDLPSGWVITEPAGMPEGCILCARKKDKDTGRVVPNASISWEPFQGTTSEYVNCVKQRHSSYYAQTVSEIKCREVGTVPTPAGTAALLHLDVSSVLGEVSLLQALLVRDGVAYAVTTGVSKECFGQASSDFLQIIRSFTVDSQTSKEDSCP
jgi:hypothetical protein